MIFPEKMNRNHKNILVVFDAAGYTPGSLRTLIELAAGLKAGIRALYVEDDNLLNAVSLPFTREISMHTAEISSTDATMMMQKFHADAASIKKEIEQIAITRRVALSFSSMRGQKTQVVRSRTEEVNMVLIPAVYSSNSRKIQHDLKHEVVMIYDDERSSCDKALAIAVSQAAKKNHKLFVIVDSAQSKQHVEQLLSEQGEHARCHIADISDVDEIIVLLNRHSPGMLVLSEDCRLIENERVLQRLINSLETDILLVH